ncbi:MAG TPA: LysR family transcriptional regulator [Burkholderiales bacterium]|nr:LysR family transcriptional regulator [Burkholderiales bacterium]
MKDRLNGMRVFAQVVEAKSFSAAADKLGMSKSLASRHVSALERSLSVKLLNRSTRKLSLTEAGALFYEHCARIVQEAELAEQRLTQTQSEPAGVVRVTTVPAFALRHVLPALSEFYQKYPKVQVRLSCSNRALDLGDEGFDLGIRVSFGPAPNLVARKLAVNRSVLCASPAYLKRRGTPRRIEDLREHECVLFPPLAPKGVWSLRRDRQKYSVQVAGVFETDEMDVVRAAVVAGLGIGILPLYMVGDALQRGELVPVLRQFQVVPESGIYLVYLPNRTLSSRVRSLIDFLAERFGPVPSWETGW